MLSFGPIASSAIASLPDYLLSNISGTFSGTVTYEAFPVSPYMQLVNGLPRVAYATELSLRALRAG